MRISLFRGLANAEVARRATDWIKGSSIRKPLQKSQLRTRISPVRPCRRVSRLQRGQTDNAESRSGLNGRSYTVKRASVLSRDRRMRSNSNMSNQTWAHWLHRSRHTPLRRKMFILQWQSGQLRCVLALSGARPATRSAPQTSQCCTESTNSGCRFRHMNVGHSGEGQ